MTYEFKPLAFGLFCIITLFALGLSAYLSRGVRTAGHFYTAGGGVKWFVNGIAFGGDYLSAASFLGIAGMIASSGFDGFMYSIGFLAGWIIALFIIAEPLRKIGKYTFADALMNTFKNRFVRLCAAISTLVVSIFYLVPQMVGAGSIVEPLIGIPYELGVVIVGALVILIVATAGMVSTTWVQFIKGFLLLIAAFALVIGVLIVSGHGPIEFIATILNSQAVHLPGGTTVTGAQFLSPGLKYTNPWDFASLALGLILGTAALPHILIRYYTVPSPADARKSTVIAIVAIGVFYILTLFLGLGANYFQTFDPKNENLAAPLLSQYIGGDVFFALISSIAFATILGTVAGLIMAAAGAIAHDIYAEVLGRRADESRGLWISKLTAVSVGVIAIALGILAKGQNVAFLVGLAFAIAASANLPAILGTLFWKKASDAGLIAGMIAGLVSSIALILLSPTIMGAHALFPLNNPGIVSIPIGFLVTIVVSLATPHRSVESSKSLVTGS